MLRHTSILILAATTALLWAFNSSAYTFTEDFGNMGIYWQSFPISVKVVSGNKAEGDLLFQKTVLAGQQWENATGQEIWDFSSNYVSSSGGSVIRWSTNFAAETGYDPISTLGVAIRYQEGPYFSKTEIILNAGMTSLYSNYNNTLGKVLLHELGHTFGLGHSNADSIMGAYIGYRETLSVDDIDGAIAAMNESHARQASGYISPFASRNSSQANNQKVAACGTVDMGNSGGNGPLSMMISLAIGLFGFLVLRPTFARCSKVFAM